MDSVTAPPEPAAVAAARRAGAPEEALVHEHLRPVWRYLRMHGADAHEADDLTQETFVVALQKGVAAFEPAAAAVFLRRTARHLFLRLRARQRRNAGAIALAGAVDALWERDCAADGGEGLIAALRRCVAALEGRAAQAVAMSYGLGAVPRASRERVAAELGMTENGVKTLLQRVRQRLRECVSRAKDEERRA